MICVICYLVILYFGIILFGRRLLLLCSVSVAMISRIAKNFQDYFLNVVTQKFGAKIFTDGLQHAMKLPYQDFEDQRSGETLSILSKVRIDVERFMNMFINVLLGILVGIVFVFVYAAIYIHWYIPAVYFIGIIFLTYISNVLSKKVKIIQKTIVGKTTALAGATTGYTAINVTGTIYRIGEEPWINPSGGGSTQ